MRAVLGLTAVTMVVEIVVGYQTRSMALLADGWHMATHVGALAIASVAYVLARRYSTHASFGFGTGKIAALAGYTSGLGLGAAAVAMVVESTQRLAAPSSVDFAASLPVAIVGLVVNLASIALLEAREKPTDRAGDEHHGHRHGHHDHPHHGHHDHNHRAVLVHVIADALTSTLAIVAIVAGYLSGVVWLDAITGLVGAAVILQWVVSLCRTTTADLLDLDPGGRRQRQVRAALEAMDGVQVVDLHVWPLGDGRHGCVATLLAASPLAVDTYRRRVLATGEVAHLTIEVRRGGHEHDAPPRAA